MHSLHVFMVCTLALAGCATKPKAAATAATTPAAPKVAPPRSDCPRGYVMVSNSRGTACWPAGNAAPPAEHCKPLPWPNTGYMLWTCPVLALSGGTIGAVEDRQEILEHCYHLAREFGVQGTPSAYEAVRSCLCELRSRVGQAEREQIAEMLRKYDARAAKIGYVPADVPAGCR